MWKMPEGSRVKKIKEFGRYLEWLCFVQEQTNPFRGMGDLSICFLLPIDGDSSAPQR